ncbi:two-component system response regulator OmpR [Escherichia coli]|nr:two-component system response regulator OmpR [Escherichia coli]
MQENYKILVVDDDMRLRALLERYLTEQGFQVRSVANAEQMDRLLTRESFHLMVLDLMLPGEDGLSICRRLRSQSNPMPIIMVTAKGEEVDRIVGLEIGADDYIPKPFNPRELLARIRAVLRRQANELPGAPSQEEAVIAFGKFKLNLGTREMFREDEPMPLTSGEFAVLKALVSHPREPLSRDKLMNLARGREYSAMERSIDVQISRLRRMVEEDPAHPRYIQTVWGLGYVQVEDDGPGIAPEQRKHLFQPFVRGDSARTISGTGLGLAIVQRIVDNHNGMLELGTSERGGLSIRAWLPVPVTRAQGTTKEG